MRTFGLAAILLGSAFAGQEPQSLVSNLQYRLTWGDLGDIVPAPFKSFRGLGIANGGDALLQQCMQNPDKWSKDPLLYRFGHHGPFSSIGCRERTSPSAHVVFYARPDGSREAWIHFDLYGPQNPFGHTAEVIRNRLVFGRTSQYNVYRGLLRNKNDGLIEPPRSYDYRSRAQEYFRSTFGPGAVAAAMVTGSAVTTIHHADGWGDGADRYRNHFEANLARHTIQQSIEFGTGALLQQDESFTSSNQQPVGRRIRSALYRSFFVPGHTSNELAVPRLAAAIGTGWIVHGWHPWQRTEIDPWAQTARILSSYVLRSFWHEFRPDIKNKLSRTKRILKHGVPASAPAAIDGDIATSSALSTPE